MRVLMLTQTYPRFPGDTAGTFIRSLAEALAAAGDEVHVVLPHDSRLELPSSPSGPRLHSFRYAPGERLHLLGYSRSMRADLGLKAAACLLGPAYVLGALRALKRLVRELRPGVVNAHWLIPNAPVAAAAGGAPLVVSLHGSDVFLAERPLFRAAARYALVRARGLTGSSQDLVDRACAIRPVPGARFIPYGVDCESFDGHDPRGARLREVLDLAADEALVLAVGRAVPKKGFDVLLEALARMRPAGWKAVVAGSGDGLEELRRQAARLGLGGRVSFPGELAHDELPAWYSAADVFVMPSVKDRAGNVDGLPNVVLEAMASGRAVVASAVGGIPAVVRDGLTGLLVRERDPEALAAALGRLIARPSERASLGAGARGQVLASLTWRAVAARYREAYLEAGQAS